ncbi:YkgJ family cysteine cluster protein [Sorangium atrum]|uniref:YkgJ family cysteine cluster protein n=1 Tax=Sorangium atrum TaxID=2995308 RepID=A0ABT5BTU0_9BACT|nr:YkgJ family cysteine cluster protein [Sorangium aterium]MDC0677580.1 YkgJ family cysteine cluster protein [Sorangium aterium]
MSQRKGKPRSASGKKGRRDARKDGVGRVHLTVLRDPVSGNERVALRSPVFREAWQNDIAAAAANTAYAALRGEPSVDGAVELARDAMAATSRLAAGLLARAPDGAVACRAGCDHCCHQSVGVTPPEALAIADHLRSTLSDAELARVAQHVSGCHDRTRSLPSAERFSPDHPCPFLRSGRCSIYEVRPLSCRGMNSLDAGECATRLRDPEARAAFLARGVGGRSFMEPIRGVHAISAGLQLSLSELFRLDMRPLELTAAMHLLLNGPDSLADAWIRGERPFESARSADKATDPGLGELIAAVGLAPGRAP